MLRPDRLLGTGFVRLSEILAPKGPIPVSRSTWWAGVKTGRFPAPVKLGPKDHRVACRRHSAPHRGGQQCLSPAPPNSISAPPK
jgi:hypothetical protein